MLHPATLKARYAKFLCLSDLMCCLDALYANFVYVRWFYVLVKIGQEMLDFFYLLCNKYCSWVSVLMHGIKILERLCSVEIFC